MFKWLFHILIFATSGKYQNKEKPLKRQRKLGLINGLTVTFRVAMVPQGISRTNAENCAGILEVELLKSDVYIQ